MSWPYSAYRSRGKGYVTPAFFVWICDIIVLTSPSNTPLLKAAEKSSHKHPYAYHTESHIQTFWPDMVLCFMNAYYLNTQQARFPILLIPNSPISAFSIFPLDPWIYLIWLARHDNRTPSCAGKCFDSLLRNGVSPNRAPDRHKESRAKLSVTS